MAELVANCPRCGSNKITFDVLSGHYTYSRYNWQRHYETFCVCRHCARSTVFVLAQKSIEHRDLLSKTGLANIKGSLSDFFEVTGYINLTDRERQSPPEHTHDDVGRAFEEAAACMSVEAWNGAAAMLRLAIDLATKPLLPQEFTPGLNRRTRRDLAPRLAWLINTGRLPRELEVLSHCIREDGNDGAHDGTLTQEDALDLMDFAVAMFERMYTEPERLRLAEERRKERRSKKEG